MSEEESPSNDSELEDVSNKSPKKYDLLPGNKLRKHTIEFTEEGKVYVCKLCSEKFDKSYALANHVKSFCVKRIQTKKDKMSKSPVRTKSATPSKRSPQSRNITRRRRTRVLTPPKNDEDIEDNNFQVSNHLAENSMMKNEEEEERHQLRDEGNDLVPSSSSEQSWLVIDGHCVADFPPELIFRLKSLKMLKLSLQIGLIENTQYVSKQEEFLESFKF